MEAENSVKSDADWMTEDQVKEKWGFDKMQDVRGTGLLTTVTTGRRYNIL